MRILGIVEADAGRPWPIDSPRGESIFVTWSPKIYHEASLWRAYRFEPLAQRFYERKKAKTNGIIAIRAIARKLARATWMMLKHQKPYDANLMFPS